MQISQFDSWYWTIYLPDAKRNDKKPGKMTDQKVWDLYRKFCQESVR